jgi:hypothetical protein
MITKGSSFAKVQPALAKLWLHSKNHDLTPRDVASDSPVIVYFICPETEHLTRADDKIPYEKEAHIVRTSVKHAAEEGLDCIGCRREHDRLGKLAITHPHFAREWHPQKNKGLTAKDVTAYSSKKVFWLCSKNARHVWQTQIGHRTGNKSGCPQCNRNQIKRRLLSTPWRRQR